MTEHHEEEQRFNDKGQNFDRYRDRLEFIYKAFENTCMRVHQGEYAEARRPLDDSLPVQAGIAAHVGSVVKEEQNKETDQYMKNAQERSPARGDDQHLQVIPAREHEYYRKGDM